MVVDYIQEIAVSMGLCPEKGLPMANDENKKLLALIDSLTDEKNLQQTTLQNFNERADRLVSHTKNSELAQNQNMKLIFAFQSDLRAEQSMRKVAERECSKLKHDIKDQQQELNMVINYEKATENDIETRNKIVSDLSNRISWIKSALIEWQHCMDEGNEANMLIEKYCKDDLKKYKEVDTKRQLLQNAINKERKNLIELAEEQKSLEQNLDRTANLYRAAHAERRQMVDTWKSAVNLMNQQEKDILATEAEYERVYRRYEQKQAELKAEENNLNNMIESNHEVEASIQVLNDETSDLREKFQYIVEMVALKENEVDIIRKELQGLANRVEQQRYQNRCDVQLKAKKEKDLENCIENNKRLKESHDTMKTKNMNTQERLRVLEEMIQSEENAKKKLTMETNQISDVYFRTLQHEQKLKGDEKLLEVENGGIRLNMSVASKALKEIQKILAKETENHYDVSLKLVLLERRVAKLKGSIVDPQEERQRLVELSQLEVHYEQSSKTLSNLQTQTTKLEGDMRNLTFCYNNDMKEINTMNFKIKEAQLYCEGGVKKVHITTRLNQEKIVELSILKMRVNEMEKHITECEDKSYNLDKHRLKLIKTIKERMVDINSQYDLMYLKKKHLSEELSTLKCDIGDRNIRIAAAKSRYELTAKVLGTNEDGSMVTATQMKVENAQEKQMLLEQGNQLNADVLRAENEIKAMEHTLALMNCSNQIYRRNFEELDEDAEDLLELKNLQAEYCELLGNLKAVRNKIIQQEREIEIVTDKREELEVNIQDMGIKKQEHTEMLTKVHKELMDQDVKIQRATREMKTAWKAVRQRSLDSVYLDNFTKDLQLQELHHRNKNVMQLFADLIENNPEISEKTTKLLYAKGIECPKPKKCRILSSWQGELSSLSLSSSTDLGSSRSSGSAPSVTRLSASTRLSMVSIDFPVETFYSFKK